MPNNIAKYDPNLSAKGTFGKGNRASVARANPDQLALKELKALWYNVQCVEDMRAIQAELKKLCLEAQNEDTKLRAITYFIDRCIGRPTENVSVDIGPGEFAPLNALDLTDHQIEVLEQIIERT